MQTGTILLTASAGVNAQKSGQETLTNKTQDQVRVLDPRTGTALLTFRQSFAHRHGLVVVPGRGSSYTYGGGRGSLGCDHIAIAQQDRPAIHFWSWGREPPRMRCSLPVRIGPMATTSDGRYLFGGTNEGRLLVWDTLTGELVQAIDAHLKAVTVVRCMKDGSHVLTGGQDADVYVWSISDLLDGATGVRAKKRRKRRDDETETDTASSSSSSTGGTATSSQMQGTYVEPVCTWNAHALGITDVLVGWCGVHGTTATSSLDHTVKFWKHGSRAPLHSMTFPTFVNCLASDDEQRTLYVGGGDGTVYVIGMRAVAAERYSSTAVGFSTSSFSSSSSNTATNANTSTSSSSSSSSSSTGLFATAPSVVNNSNAQNGSVSSWDAIEGCHAGPILSIVHSGTTLYTGGGDGIVRAWDTTTRQQLFAVAHAGPVTNLQIVPRPTDLLRSRQSGNDKRNQGHGAPLRPFPPLQKHRRVDHSGIMSTFLAATSGVDGDRGSGNSSSIKCGDVVVETEVVTGSGPSIIGGEDLDANTSIVKRLVELENENLRWQTLATKLRGMLDDKNAKESGKKRRNA